MIPFLDIYSGSQGEHGIDWVAVAKYLLDLHPEAGVIIKVSEGTDYVNPFLHQQRMGAHAAGIKNVGLYHFDRASQASGAKQAAFFMKGFGDDGGILKGEFLCWDEEDVDVPATSDLDAEVIDATGAISRALGIKVVFYSGRWYLDPHNLNRDPKLLDLGLWLADVSDPTGKLVPPTPEPWRSAGKSLLFLQYNWKGKVPGIFVPVDLDYLIGDISSLRPYQWGFMTDPLGDKLVAGKPDIDVTEKGEALDTNKAAQAIARNIELARRLYVSRGTVLDSLLATAQGDAAAIALVSGLQS